MNCTLPRFGGANIWGQHWPLTQPMLVPDGFATQGGAASRTTGSFCVRHAGHARIRGAELPTALAHNPSLFDGASRSLGCKPEPLTRLGWTIPPCPSAQSAARISSACLR